MELLLAYLAIFLARVADVSLDVIRVLLLTRGRRMLATVVGFVEVSIFIVMLNFVLQNGLTDPGKIIAYAAGFATGNFLGSLIEERMAMGFLQLQAFPPMMCGVQLVEAFRNAGFGVTTVAGEGSRGARPVLYVFMKRKDLGKALKILDETGIEIFYNVTDCRSYHGGILPPAPGRITVRK